MEIITFLGSIAVLRLIVIKFQQLNTDGNPYPSLIVPSLVDTDFIGTEEIWAKNSLNDYITGTVLPFLCNEHYIDTLSARGWYIERDYGSFPTSFRLLLPDHSKIITEPDLSTWTRRLTSGEFGPYERVEYECNCLRNSEGKWMVESSKESIPAEP